MDDQPDWEPIKVGPGEVKSFDESIRRLVVSFPLDGEQPQAWREYVFENLLHTGDLSAPKPELRGAAILIRSREGEAELKAWRDAVTSVVEEANNYYINSYASDQGAPNKAAQAHAEDRRRRVEEAQRILDASDSGDS